tara:strand:+ start:3666 stop:3821 length:156 start_codon:yes stop_codon:yes gene_type:complete
MILFDSDNAPNEALKTTLFEKERLNLGISSSFNSALSKPLKYLWLLCKYLM